MIFPNTYNRCNHMPGSQSALPWMMGALTCYQGAQLHEAGIRSRIGTQSQSLQHSIGMSTWCLNSRPNVHPLFLLILALSPFHFTDYRVLLWKYIQYLLFTLNSCQALAFQWCCNQQTSTYTALQLGYTGLWKKFQKVQLVYKKSPTF